MGFSADAGGAALVAVVVVGDTDVGSVVDEQLASNIARHAASPAMWMGWTPHRLEAFIDDTTASVPGFTYGRTLARPGESTTVFV
jgi:hypothetical protein